jgi:hypothetical protein
MKRQSSFEVFSIFGQIESVVAKMMVDEGKAKLIELQDIPPSAAYDDEGRRAFFAILINRNNIGEFEYRIRDLAA